MRTFAPIVFVATATAVAFAQSSTDLPPASESSSMTEELAAIVECSTTQLNEAQGVLTTNRRQEQCETALNLAAGTMLQVTTVTAESMCDIASCKAALQELYNALPNCRYNLWGLQHSAQQLLEHCGITPTNTTNLKSNTNPPTWSVASKPPSSDEVTSSTVNDTAAASTSPPESSAAVSATTVSAVLAMTVGIASAFLT